MKQRYVPNIIPVEYRIEPNQQLVDWINKGRKNAFDLPSVTSNASRSNNVSIVKGDSNHTNGNSHALMPHDSTTGKRKKTIVIVSILLLVIAAIVLLVRQSG